LHFHETQNGKLETNSGGDRRSAVGGQNISMNRLILFTRYPEPGKVKTRLIPALGAAGAAYLQRKMTEFTLQWARELRPKIPLSVEIRYAGGETQEMQEWLGPDLIYAPQGEGDLGSRMLHGFADAFQGGMEKVILIGTDLPGLNEPVVASALQALDTHDLVLGPAHDGGYYLIGLRFAEPALFHGIPWGTDRVLAKTLAIAKDLRLQVSLLEILEDVDRPEDLPIWEEFLRTRLAKGRISVIITALNEEERIGPCLESARGGSADEIIVVDGGSEDRTVEAARRSGAKVLSSPPGRARQLNTGAKEASGDILLFLHADTLLPRGYEKPVRETLSQAGTAAGAFEFQLDATSFSLRMIERVANWRARYLQMPYGDQAIFLSAFLFHAVGGYPDMPIMEDFELIRRLKKKGRIRIARLPAVTSGRRWLTFGAWRTTLTHWTIVMAYYLGIPPSRIHSWARRDDGKTGTGVRRNQ